MSRADLTPRDEMGKTVIGLPIPGGIGTMPEEILEEEEWWGNLAQGTVWRFPEERIVCGVLGEVSYLEWLEYEKERIEYDPCRIARIHRVDGFVALFVNRPWYAGPVAPRRASSSRLRRNGATWRPRR